MTIGLILASTSPYRRALLDRLGLEFETASPSFTEGTAPEPVDASTAAALASSNAEGKARSLQSMYPEHVILGSDQVCFCEGRILHKAGSVDRAVEQLQWLRGRTHSLFTAVALLDTRSDQIRSTVTTTTLSLRDVSDADLRRYVELEKPLDSAGSYYSEQMGIVLFEKIESSDPTAVIGLPLIAVSGLLRAAGIDSLATEAVR